MSAHARTPDQPDAVLDMMRDAERTQQAHIAELEYALREWRYRAENAEFQLEALAQRLEQHVRLRGL